MNTEPVDKIATAVLYEGYILYPYRPSLKNCRRTMFGAVYPRSYAAGTPERWAMQTECLVEGDPAAAVEVQVRFLHWTERAVGHALDATVIDDNSQFALVDAVEVDGQLDQRWEEAVERRIDVGPLNLSDLIAAPARLPIHFPAAREVEWLSSGGSQRRAAFIRGRRRLDGLVELSARLPAPGLFSLRVRIKNLTEGAAWGPADVQMSAFHSTHTILGIAGGRFVSLMDPPDAWRDLAATMCNEGTWPVLAGDESRRDLVLSSPIILYDFPQIAPESAGDHFDATEIDEMLGLRIATMTDDEKQRMRAVDPAANQILHRTEQQADEAFRNLHGTLRSLRRVAVAGDEPR